MIGIRTVIVLAGLQLLLPSARVAAQTGENILLVTNGSSEASQEIGAYYAQARTIPGSQIIRLVLPVAEEISRRDYDTKIEQPIAEWLTANQAQDRILYLVLTKDVPLRIAGTGGANGTVASVDSELVLLYRKLYGGRVQLDGRLTNPLFVDERPLTSVERFTHRTYDMYLVGRLDGYTVQDVKALIDRGISPAAQGNVVLDGKLELTESPGNKWLTAAAAALKKLPGWSDRVVLDSGQATLTDQSNVIGFYTWGSNAVVAKSRHFNHTFAPGAIGAEYVSTDARTFKEPPANWVVNDTKSPFGGSHQSLIGDLIRDGISGVAGHVAEPFLNGTIRPDILFPAYVAGFNLIESFYLAMPAVSWQTIVVGDVLCAPFGPKPSPATDLNPAVDPNTELPAFFQARRLRMLTAVGIKPEAAPWLARSEVESAKKNPAGARQALEEATKIDADYLPAQLALGLLYQQAKEWDSAIERFQFVIEKNPTHAVALNNLAYVMALHKGDPAGALPLARRAYLASIRNPATSDTLAWIYHLMGDDSTAEPIITIAVQRVPDSAEIQLHTAVILAATGKTAAATQHLDAAIRLDPGLEAQQDVQDLRKRLQPAK